MSIHKPSWFSDDTIMVSTAPTCGLSKGGRPLPLVNKATGARIQVKDPETGEMVDAVNDQLLEDVLALKAGKSTTTLRLLKRTDVSLRAAVPVYYDRRFDNNFAAEMKTKRFSSFTSATLGDLAKKGIIQIRGGHGSPSAEQRIGDVPYIKVSDLRAGLVNINPTNRVPLKIAQKYWRGGQSGLKAFDIVCPERTSKNIGDFCVLMPDQERVLLTKEIIVIRPGSKANFDSFYLIWALTLKIVRDQWKRVVFMQTNREDVGKRYLEISSPVPKNADVGKNASESFRDYYKAISSARSNLSKYLDADSEHHFFVSGAEPDEEGAAALAGVDLDQDSTVPAVEDES